jgi:hypothetical protein
VLWSGPRYRSPPPTRGRHVRPELPDFAARIVFDAGFGIENHGRPLRYIVGGPMRNLRVVGISRLRKRDQCRAKRSHCLRSRGSRMPKDTYTREPWRARICARPAGWRCGGIRRRSRSAPESGKAISRDSGYRLHQRLVDIEGYVVLHTRAAHQPVLGPSGLDWPPGGSVRDQRQLH